jgi:hypothetical protein
MDRLDRWTVVSVLALSLYATGLMYMGSGSSQPGQGEQASQSQLRPVASPELEGKLQTARTLLAQDNLEKTEALLTPLLQQFPYEG